MRRIESHAPPTLSIPSYPPVPPFPPETHNPERAEAMAHSAGAWYTGCGRHTDADPKDCQSNIQHPYGITPIPPSIPPPPISYPIAAQH